MGVLVVVVGRWFDTAGRARNTGRVAIAAVVEVAAAGVVVADIAAVAVAARKSLRNTRGFQCAWRIPRMQEYILSVVPRDTASSRSLPLYDSSGRN